MSGNQEVTYALDFDARRQGRRKNRTSSVRQPLDDEATDRTVPQVARLMALAIRFEGMIARGEVKDYADLARLGHVTRARVTQVMNLLNLAPDRQELAACRRC